ncbi:MAG: hypothetical protein GX022_05395 [Clostridiaceae bacterium]|nr:hypothetical protein [Clostridiaceae bacterium]
MKRNLFTLSIALLMALVLTVPVFAAAQGASNHWAVKYVDELALKNDISPVFSVKDLNSYITVEDFQKAVKLFLDENYEGSPDSVAREAIVYEFTRIWAEKTGNNLDEIMTIQVLIYEDTDKIDPKYNHAITVAYLNDIARGRGNGIFDPKTNTTYGELATLIYFTDKAISKSLEQSLEEEAPSIVKGRLETRASHEIKDGKVVFDMELISHYTKPVELNFSSGQQFEITVTDESGNEVYRYSDGKFFTLALLYKTINPGESLKWQDEWDLTNKDGEKLTSGSYKAVIKILASSETEKIDDSELTATIEFTLN